MSFDNITQVRRTEVMRQILAGRSLVCGKDHRWRWSDGSREPRLSDSLCSPMVRRGMITLIDPLDGGNGYQVSAPWKIKLEQADKIVASLVESIPKRQARETKRELQEKYRQAVMGLRFLAGATDDLLVHEILDETFERIGEPKEEPKETGDG